MRLSSVRALVAFAVENGMHNHQMDVVTAFLNGELDKEIYMKQPDGYVQDGQEHLVCKLKKSLYGLKQAPRCWNKVFTKYMESIGFRQSTADPCVFIRSRDTLDVIAVYVDDLISKTEEEIQRLKNDLASRLQDDRFGKTSLLPRHYC